MISSSYIKLIIPGIFRQLSPGQSQISIKEKDVRFKTRVGLILTLGLCAAVNLMAQKPADMVGTWVGMATLEGMAEPNELILVLNLKEGNLTGHMTDQYGTMNESPIEKIQLEGGVFSFSVNGMGPGGQEISFVFKMNVDGDSMEGSLEIPDMGMNGTWEATKQKEDR